MRMILCGAQGSTHPQVQSGGLAYCVCTLAYCACSTAAWFSLSIVLGSKC